MQEKLLYIRFIKIDIKIDLLINFNLTIMFYLPTYSLKYGILWGSETV